MTSKQRVHAKNEYMPKLHWVLSIDKEPETAVGWLGPHSKAPAVEESNVKGSGMSHIGLMDVRETALLSIREVSDMSAPIWGSLETLTPGVSSREPGKISTIQAPQCTSWEQFQLILTHLCWLHGLGASNMASSICVCVCARVCNA